MGLIRLRNRLNHLEGDADATMAAARDLLADLSDGFAIQVEIDAAQAMDLANKLISGVGVPGKFVLPVSLRILPEG